MADIGAKIAIDGEKQFRQELANITQAGKTLSAQMDSLTSSFDKTDASEEEMSKVSKKLSEQIENQRKLVDKLQEAVQRSSEKTGENSTETLKWKEKLAKAETELGKLERQADGAGKELGEFTSEEKNATNQTSIFSNMLKANLASEAIKKGVSALAGVVKDVAKFFVDAVKGAAEYADEVGELSSKTGMSTEAIQEYKYAADLLDVSFETISGSMTKLTRSMDSARDGGKTASEAFAKLGVDVTDANGNLRDSNAVFDDVIVALGKIDNETERDAIAMEVFGKSAKELNPLIDAGAEKLSDLRDEAHRVGAVMSDDALAGAQEFKDGLDRLSGSWDALKRTLGAKIGAKILPELEKLVGLFQDLAATGDFGKFIDGVVDMIDDLISKFPALTDRIIKALPKVLSKIANAIGKLLPKLGSMIGDLLGQLFRNMPDILMAGLELGYKLIEGVLTAIPNMISGIVNAFKSPKISAAAQAAAEKLESIQKALDSIPTAAERAESNLASVDAKMSEARHWVQVFDELSKKTNPTASDTERLKTAVDKLNELFPELGIKINNRTGEWNKNTDAIVANLKALEARARAEAYSNAASEMLQSIAETEVEFEKAVKERDELLHRYNNWGEYIDGLRLVQDTWHDLVKDYDNGLLSEEEYVRKFNQITGLAASSAKEIDDIAVTAGLTLADTGAAYNNLHDELQGAEDAVKEYGDKLVEMNNDVEWLFDKSDEWSKKAADTGKQVALGLVKGMDSQVAIVKAEAGRLIGSAIRQMKEVAQIHSPSRVTENLIGKNLALGVIKGWEDVFSLRNPLSLRGAINGAASTTNNMNLGGVSVNVYAQEGQDANAIAQLVMRKMQGAVDARKAVFA